ncbi:hypothetical protein P9112_007617 [Eukaryota sp. TZLM1-RC]
MYSSSDSESELLRFKVILLGDGAVGKTSTVYRFVDDYFAKSYKQTVGLDFFSRNIDFPNDTRVTLQLWDIGGQTIGSKMLSKYIYGSHAIILVYDITNLQSFHNLHDWLNIVRRTYQDESLPHLILLGTKTDLAHLRMVKPDKHNDFARENDMSSFFLSAKTGDNVNAVFHRIAADLAHVPLSKHDVEAASKVVPAQIVNHSVSSSNEQNNEDKKGCCIM